MRVTIIKLQHTSSKQRFAAHDVLTMRADVCVRFSVVTGAVLCMHVLL
jgi:hypothetical protein